MDISDFLPKYPNIQNVSEEILNPYNSPFNDVIVSKKELYDLRLRRVENVRGKGEKYNHQKIIARFMASMTPYDQLLLFHEMGTGKTCTSIAAIEQLRYDKNSHITGAIILAKGKSLLKNFTQELLFTCTDGRYIPDNYDQLSDLERAHRIGKITSEFYSFFTFETFAKSISNLSDKEIATRFSNNIIVLDEVHNIREKEDKTNTSDPEGPRGRRNVLIRDPLYVYKQLHRFLHAVKQCKIILMSGTVMKDDSSEFASIMNLILPLNQQFPTDKLFHTTYFHNNIFKPEKIAEFSNMITGRVSYLKAMTSEVRKVFNGAKIGALQHFLVYPDHMSSFQTKFYIKAYERDLSERSIFISSRQASLFVFPDGSYGSEGFDKYVTVSHRNVFAGRGKRTGFQTYSLKPELLNEIGRGSVETRLKNLSKFSSKYAATIGTILSKQAKSLVYSEYVSGGGAILFSKILELFGFKRATGDETTKSPRYAILTTHTTNVRRTQSIINRFNSEDNIDGEFISVIIGSRIISEGFTLKNIRQEFILTPHWNFSETSQVIARGWRLGSHHGLIERGDRDLKVDIYLQVSLPLRGTALPSVPSIDLEMYETSERKDYLMRQIEYLVKQSAFDCPLTLERNRMSNEYDDTRDCEYNKCEYTCSGNVMKPLDKITYNLYYISTEIAKKRLQEYFRTENFISFSRLFTLLGELDRFEIIHAIKTFIDTDVAMYNKFGQLSYLRVCNNFIFNTTDVKTHNNDIFATFYTSNALLQYDSSFDSILDDMFEERIPNMIQTLFDDSIEETVIPEIMSVLPEIVQRTILQSCIEARYNNLTKNTHARDSILVYYKGYYDSLRVDGREWWVVWFHRELFGISCFSKNEPWTDYLTKSQSFIDAIDEHISAKRGHLYNSPVGFYGMHNPQLDDFCLRDVRTYNPASRDLRKLTVGRRCVDFEHSTLLDLLVRKIKAPYRPNDYLAPFDTNELEKMVLENKYHTPEDLISTESMKRFIYWVKRKRVEICKNIQRWMNENDLIEPSLDCGTQQKQRGRIDK